MNKSEKYCFFLFNILFVIACALPIFYKLGHLPVPVYDEARLAVNTVEMVENGNWLVTHFEGQPDMWNTKPPLLIWCQAICIKLLGHNEWAFRLPSALAAVATIILLLWFCWFKLHRPLLGYLAALILLTSQGYVRWHVIRTGDYDALLTFWNTAQVICFFLFIHANNQREERKYLFLLSLCIALAVLTKSIVGLMFLPPMFLYVIWQKQLFHVLKMPKLYLAIAGTLGIIGAYYGLREIYNPGYIQAVWDNELGGRYLTTIEGHRHAAGFYIERLWGKKFVHWIYFLPLLFFVYPLINQQQKRFTILAGGTCLFFLLFISTAQTKIGWYDAPIYPLLAILAAIVIEKIMMLLRIHLPFKRIGLQYLAFTFLLLGLFGQPYRIIVDEILLNNKQVEAVSYRDFIEQLNNEHANYYISYVGYNASAYLYIKLFQAKDYPISQKPPQNLESGDTVMLCETNAKNIVYKKFTYDVLATGNQHCELIRITQ